MAIAFIIHEATRTGAPRVGALIARELARGEDVRVIVMRDGPLTPWLRRTLGPVDLVVCRKNPFEFREPFDERLRRARDMLRETPADVVYVNSLASAVFAFAAALESRKVVVHVHEKRDDIMALLSHDVAKLETLRVADAAVLAADDLRADLVDVFQTLPAELQTFGIAVEVEAVRKAAAEPPLGSPLNAHGEPLRRGQRLVVGMSGHASARKGADVFLEAAATLREHDFLWIGPWSAEDAPENVAFPDYERLALPNLYVTGPVDNPFPYMRLMDMFFLSSREDPNPLVLAEAMALQLPILAFTGATAVTERLGRYAVVLHGEANAADAVRVLRTCDPEAVRRPAFRSVGDAYLSDYDLSAKMSKLRDLIARVRGETPAASAAVPHGGASQRSLGQGVVELTFS